MAIYLLNTPVITAYGLWRFSGPLTLEDVQRTLANGFHSGVGHPATAVFLSELLALDCPFNRKRITLNVGDTAIVLRLLCRLPEGKLLAAHEIRQLPYEFGLLQRLA